MSALNQNAANAVNSGIQRVKISTMNHTTMQPYQHSFQKHSTNISQESRSNKGSKFRMAFLLRKESLGKYRTLNDQRVFDTAQDEPASHILQTEVDVEAPVEDLVDPQSTYAPLMTEEACSSTNRLVSNTILFSSRRKKRGDACNSARRKSRSAMKQF